MKPNHIFRRPLVSENSLSDQEKGRLHFWVDRLATKNQIAAAFEKIFSVKPFRVNTMLVKGKVKFDQKNRRPRRRPTFKKAIIVLKKGDKVDIFATKKKK